MYIALNLAKYIVSKCEEDNQPISNLYLQKLLYYIQKEFLLSGKQAFADDIEAWPFGQVVPNVYNFFCGFGSMPITNVYKECLIADNDKKIIDKIIETKRTLEPWDMTAETQGPNSPWAIIYNNGKGKRHIIPIALIKNY